MSINHSLSTIQGSLKILIAKIKLEGGYTDQLVLAKSLIESYNEKVYTSVKQLEKIVNENLGFIEVRNDSDNEFDINCLMHRVNWDHIKYLCDGDEDFNATKIFIKDELLKAVDAYNDTPGEVSYVHKYCSRCRALLKPNSTAYTEGYHFDSCI